MLSCIRTAVCLRSIVERNSLALLSCSALCLLLGMLAVACSRCVRVSPCPLPCCCCGLLLQGVCSNMACPYLHVKVAADARPCKAFLQGYCAAGAACPHKHLTPRMVKQQQQQQGGKVVGDQVAAAGTSSRQGKWQRQQQPVHQPAVAAAVGGAAAGSGDGAPLLTQRTGSGALYSSLAALLPDCEPE
jgi:hypothetical protein